MRDILWSDPWDQSDVVDNFKRNAGCLIPDGALGEWLQREKFVRLVRSHETEATGAAVTQVPHGERWTVFSCSHYPNRQGLNKAAVLQVDARGAVKVRRWDAGEDDRAQGALAARVRGALWRHRSRSVWKSTSELVYRHRADAATGTTSRRWRGAPEI